MNPESKTPWNLFSLPDATTMRDDIHRFKDIIVELVEYFNILAEKKKGTSQYFELFHSSQQILSELDHICANSKMVADITKDFIYYFNAEKLLEYDGNSNLDDYLQKKKQIYERKGFDENSKNFEEYPVCALSIHATWIVIQNRIKTICESKKKDNTYKYEEDTRQIYSGYFYEDYGVINKYYAELEENTKYDASFPYFPHRPFYKRTDDGTEQKTYKNFMKLYQKLESNNPRLVTDSGIHHLMLHFSLYLAKSMQSHILVATERLSNALKYLKDGEVQFQRYANFEYKLLPKAVKRIALMVDILYQIDDIYYNTIDTSTYLFEKTLSIRNENKEKIKSDYLEDRPTKRANKSAKIIEPTKTPGVIKPSLTIKIPSNVIQENKKVITQTNVQENKTAIVQENKEEFKSISQYDLIRLTVYVTYQVISNFYSIH